MVILFDDDINGDYYGVTWFYYPIHYPIYWEWSQSMIGNAPRFRQTQLPTRDLFSMFSNGCNHHKEILGATATAKVAMLTSACEAFSSILFFPLAWVHCYNPLLPCTDYLQTPPPFLFGVLREIILKETGGASDLLSSELLGPKSCLGLAESRDFSIVDLDTGAGPRQTRRYMEVFWMLLVLRWSMNTRKVCHNNGMIYIYMIIYAHFNKKYTLCCWWALLVLSELYHDWSISPRTP